MRNLQESSCKSQISNFKSQISSLLAFLLAAAAVSARAEPPTATMADGAPLAAQLAAVDDHWQVTLDTDGRQQTLPAADLASWGTCVEPARGPILVLADGGLLPADPQGTEGGLLTAHSQLLGPLRLPMESLSGVVLRLPPGGQDRQKLLDRIARANGDSDRLLLDNGDELTGLVERLGPGKVELKAEAGPLSVEFRRIVAIVLSPALRQSPAAEGLYAWIGLSDGSRLPVRRLIVTRPGDCPDLRPPVPSDRSKMGLSPSTLELTTLSGQTWHAASKELVFLQPLGGRSVYLSDLQPAEYRHVPYLALAWPWLADRNVTGGPLRCGGRLWLKGLGLHSAARLSYALDRPWKSFRAELGIDDSTAGRGSVAYRVLVDGQEKAAGGPIRGGTPPAVIAVDLAGAKRLELIVDYAERGDVLDHADWLNARLVK